MRNLIDLISLFIFVSCVVLRSKLKTYFVRKTASFDVVILIILIFKDYNVLSLNYVQFIPNKNSRLNFKLNPMLRTLSGESYSSIFGYFSLISQATPRAYLTDKNPYSVLMIKTEKE